MKHRQGTDSAVPPTLTFAAPGCLSIGTFVAKYPTSVGHQHLPKIPKKNPMVSHRARSVRDSRIRTSSCHVDAEMYTVVSLPQPYR